MQTLDIVDAASLRSDIPAFGPGDTVKARATVIELKPESSRVMLETVCTVGDTVVIAGQAEVLVPRRNKQEA